MKLSNEPKMKIEDIIKYSRIRSFFYFLILIYLVTVIKIAVESGGYMITVWILATVFTMSFFFKENTTRKLLVGNIEDLM